MGSTRPCRRPTLSYHPLVHPLFRKASLYVDFSIFKQIPSTHTSSPFPLSSIAPATLYENISVAYEGQRYYPPGHGCVRLTLGNPRRSTRSFQTAQRQKQRNKEHTGATAWGGGGGKEITILSAFGGARTPYLVRLCAVLWPERSSYAPRGVDCGLSITR